MDSVFGHSPPAWMKQNKYLQGRMHPGVKCIHCLDWMCVNVCNRAYVKQGVNGNARIIWTRKVDTTHWTDEGWMSFILAVVLYSFPKSDSAKLKDLSKSFCQLLQEPSLYTVKAVFILDNDGNRLLSKVRWKDHTSDVPYSPLASTNLCLNAHAVDHPKYTTHIIVLWKSCCSHYGQCLKKKKGSTLIQQNQRYNILFIPWLLFPF